MWSKRRSSVYLLHLMIFATTLLTNTAVAGNADLSLRLYPAAIKQLSYRAFPLFVGKEQRDHIVELEYCGVTPSGDGKLLGIVLPNDAHIGRTNILDQGWCNWTLADVAVGAMKSLSTGTYVETATIAARWSNDGLSATVADAVKLLPSSKSAMTIKIENGAIVSFGVGEFAFSGQPFRMRGTFSASGLLLLVSRALDETTTGDATFAPLARDTDNASGTIDYEFLAQQLNGSGAQTFVQPDGQRGTVAVSRIGRDGPDTLVFQGTVAAGDAARFQVTLTLSGHDLAYDHVRVDYTSADCRKAGDLDARVACGSRNAVGKLAASSLEKRFSSPPPRGVHGLAFRPMTARNMYPLVIRGKKYALRAAVGAAHAAPSGLVLDGTLALDALE